MERSQPNVVLRLTAEVDGEERCVVWRNGRLAGDTDWIARAEQDDPELAQRPPFEIVHALEAAMTGPVSLLVSDDVADDSLAGREVIS